MYPVSVIKIVREELIVSLLKAESMLQKTTKMTEIASNDYFMTQLKEGTIAREKLMCIDWQKLALRSSTNVFHKVYHSLESTEVC